MYSSRGRVFSNFHVVAEQDGYTRVLFPCYNQFNISMCDKEVCDILASWGFADIIIQIFIFKFFEGEKKTILYEVQSLSFSTKGLFKNYVTFLKRIIFQKVYCINIDEPYIFKKIQCR